TVAVPPSVTLLPPVRTSSVESNGFPFVLPPDVAGLVSLLRSQVARRKMLATASAAEAARSVARRVLLMDSGIEDIGATIEERSRTSAHAGASYQSYPNMLLIFRPDQ